MGEVERALITFPAPHGPDAVTLHDGEAVDLGRAGSCQVRFGHAPVRDDGLARVAGRLVAANRRVYVESSDEVGHRAIEVHVHGSPPMQVPLGDAYSPGAEQFDVVVRGESTWRIGVAVRAAERDSYQGGGIDSPTERVDLELTDRERAVLAAYYAPLQAGRPEPATHGQVAEALSYHPNTVRDVIYGIWSKMFVHGLQLRDVSDKRMAVVEAARVHGLLRTES